MKKLAIGTVVLLIGIAAASFGQTKMPKVDAREKNQQERAKEGVNSGELTPAETRTLEMQQGKIKADEMNAKADGKVTPAERRHLKHEQNRASRNIYRKKHNERKPGGQ